MVFMVTVATMRRLSPSERVDELISMMGADADSVPARKHAQELLDSYKTGGSRSGVTA